MSLAYWLINKRRTETNNLPHVSIFELKRRGMIDGSDIQDFGDVEVASNMSNEYGSLPSAQKFRFRYWAKDGDSSKTAETYVGGIFTPCRYGGKRWWFICPQYSCQRRVGVLYVKKGIWGCRHCLNLCYASQNENKRMAFLGRSMILENKIAELDKRIKRRYYNRKPTRLQRRFNQLINLPY